MSDHSMDVNRQWASRPADERFVSLTELHAAVQSYRKFSRAKVLSSRQITAVPVENDNQGLAVQGPNGGTVALTNWSFGQLAARAGAPAGYLRTLPGAMTADCINYGLHVANGAEDIGVLLQADPEGTNPPVLRAATGPNYGRVWNETVTRALVERFGDGLTGQFRVPGEFGVAVPITRENTTLYASDRDMFVFLADEEHRIELPNRRNGETGTLARGFLIWNSEVGSATLGIALFLFDYLCKNRIIWGLQNYQEIRIRHTASAPDRWIEEAAPAIQAYANSATGDTIRVIEAARARSLGSADKVDEFLQARFNRSQVGAIKAAFMADEQRPIESLWDVATGVTAYARGIAYQNDRVELERAAGKVLALAS